MRKYGRRNRPWSSVSLTVDTLVSAWRAVTRAIGTAAPVASRTRPLTLPFSSDCCAPAGTAAARHTNAIKKTNFTDLHPGVERHDDCRHTGAVSANQVPSYARGGGGSGGAVRRTASSTWRGTTSMPRNGAVKVGQVGIRPVGPSSDTIITLSTS